MSALERDNLRQDYDWAEPLPPGCPPEDCVPPQNANFYRLVKSIPPSEQDFWSYRKLHPNRNISVGECELRSCSVWSELGHCRDVLKLPMHRTKMVVELTLFPESGLVKQTGSKRSHYSWWRARVFDPVANCVHISLEH